MTSSSISLQSHETLRDGLLRVVDDLIDPLTNSQAHVPLGRKIWRQKPGRFAQKIVQHWSKR